MSPDDPRHGTYAGAQAHKKTGTPICDPCREARRAYQRHLSYDHDRNRRRRVSPKRAARHALALEAAGVPLSQIALRAGVSRGTVFRAVGRSYPQPPAMEATKLAAILSVPFPDAPANRGYVPRIGVIRRVRALNAIGWPRTEIAARLGMTPQNLTQLVNGCRGADARPNAWVQGETWHKVADLYDELCMIPGPSRRSRIVAARKGWAPPLAWVNIDDANEKPTEIRRHWHAGPNHNEVDHAVVERLLSGERIKATRAEKEEALRRWVAAGRPARQFTEMHRWHDGRYAQNEDAA